MFYLGNDQNCSCHNYDVAYDSSRDCCYAIREMHPYPSANPSYIGRSLQLVSIAGSSIWNGGGSWRIEGSITPGTTNFARNHNNRLKCTPYGALADPARLEPVFT